MENHEPFLREAIALSKAALDHGNEPFGAVLVRDGEVVLRAENSVFSGHDMTNHAEMNLVKLAAQHFDAKALGEFTLYTSTEPCAMCAGAIYWSGIGRMVFACSESRLGEIAGIGLSVPSRAILETGARKVTVVGPTNLEPEAAEVHQSFWPEHLSKAQGGGQHCPEPGPLADFDPISDIRHVSRTVTASGPLQTLWLSSGAW